MKYLALVGAFLVSVSLAVSGCGNDSESVAPLQCPPAESELAQNAQPEVKVSTRQMTDEIAMGDKAKLQVEPGAGMGGNIIVCGREATLVLRDSVKRAAVLGGDVARVVLQDETPKPFDLEMVGKSRVTIRCNKEKHEPDRPSCNEFFLS